MEKCARAVLRGVHALRESPSSFRSHALSQTDQPRPARRLPKTDRASLSRHDPSGVLFPCVRDGTCHAASFSHFSSSSRDTSSSAADSAASPPPSGASSPSPAAGEASPSPSSPSPSPPLGAPAFSPDRLHSLFARADVLANLLHSRLALPLLYPLNSGGGLTNPLNVPGGSPGSDASALNSIASSRWKREEVVGALATVTPLVLAATSVSRFLKAAHALSYYSGPTCGTQVSGRRLRDRRGGTPQTEENDGGRAQAAPALGRSRVHFLRPQLWRVLKPGEEGRTKHLKWR
ncbi:hypothetical protein BESB_026120 [Besnoitia besnoiti]|uniref:Uncharacterized protein n=1 Tax=Besnoitia besnoiti TaxID=94643 RepID=A0A2A9LYX0_BESBE|nr:uncharacterized protein BESB_026120 [Besnoitia besnoiti]PFH31638.1 hypothetical protein BESB_026120 [Besnoitia besnoiti]